MRILLVGASNKCGNSFHNVASFRLQQTFVFSLNLARDEETRICQTGYLGGYLLGLFRGEDGLGKNAELTSAGNCLGPIGRLELTIDAGCMGFDGARRYDESLGDFLIGHTQGHEMEHFQLTLA